MDQIIVITTEPNLFNEISRLFAHHYSVVMVGTIKKALSRIGAEHAIHRVIVGPNIGTLQEIMTLLEQFSATSPPTPITMLCEEAVPAETLQSGWPDHIAVLLVSDLPEKLSP